MDAGVLREEEFRCEEGSGEEGEGRRGVVEVRGAEGFECYGD